MATNEERNRLKEQAAERALKLVEPGMAVGLGSGSTATLWIKLLGEKVRNEGLKIRAIASSDDSEKLGRSYGIPFTTFEETPSLDLTVDGADEIAPGLCADQGRRRKAVAGEDRGQRIEALCDRCRCVKTGGEAWQVSSARRGDPDGRAAGDPRVESDGFTPKIRTNKDGSNCITDEAI